MTCEEMIQSDVYTEILIDPVALGDFSEELMEQTCYHEITPRIGVLYMEAARVPPIRITESDYAYFPKVYGLMAEGSSIQDNNTSLFNPLSLLEAGILTVQSPPLNLTGTGVTIGFIDTGIDYGNPVFLAEDGTSRILGIWDQTIIGGNVPKGFLYGSEYNQDDIERALSSENPYSLVPSKDENGHGTMVASVAAGSILDHGQRFIGAAPDSKIVMVKLKEANRVQRNWYSIPDTVPCYMESDILQALQYLQKFAREYVKPLVICIGVGTNLGDHGGSGILSEYMSHLAQLKSRAMVIGGGNEGNARHHFMGEYGEGEDTKEIELQVAESEQGFVVEIWGRAPYRFGLLIRTPGGETIRPIFRSGDKSQTYTFVFEQSRVTIDYLLIEASSGKSLIRILLEEPTAGIWTLQIRKESQLRGGRIHAWLPISGFIQEGTYFLTSDPKVTLVEPANEADSITVTSYEGENGSLAITSSRGFTSDDRRKPDIAAPGVLIPTIRGRQSGSSMAAALTAGGVAQFMQWAVIEGNDLFVDSRKVKNYLVRGAIRESNMEYPNREWGFGKLNIAGIFKWLAGF
ncbi:MAG: S8 family peptidase [Eubacteriales bacterium]